MLAQTSVQHLIRTSMLTFSPPLHCLLQNSLPSKPPSFTSPIFSTICTFYSPSRTVFRKWNITKVNMSLLKIKIFNPICQIDPHFFCAFFTAKRPGKSGWNFLTFPIYPLTKDLTKKIWIFLEGAQPRNDPPSLPMTRFLQNFFIL